MTNKFEALLIHLKSEDTQKIQEAFSLARNYRAEFKVHFLCSIEDYEELYHYLKIHERQENWFEDNEYGNDFLKGIVLDEIRYQDQKNINFIPNSIKHLKELKFLRFYNCALSNIPKEIRELSKLTKIEANNNALQAKACTI